jgi:hypothetical protein
MTTLVPASQVVPSLLAAFAGVPSAQFAKVTYRAKGTGELAIHTLGLNFDIELLYHQDITAVGALYDGYKQDYAKDNTGTAKLRMLAAGAILASLKESIAKGIGNNSAYTHGPHAGDTYVNLTGVKNCKVHKENGTVYVLGFSVSKKIVLEAGEYKEVNSLPLTIEKNKIRAELQTGHIRQFVVERVSKLQMAGETIEIVEDDAWKKGQVKLHKIANI